MSELDKQIRLRATAEEKKHLETAASDAGYANLSDYLRHALFDQNVLIVGDRHTRFVLVPAYSSVEEEREEAMQNLRGLLALAELAREQPTPTSEPTDIAPSPPGAPEGPEQPPVDAGEAPRPSQTPAVEPAAQRPQLAAVPDDVGPTGPHTGPTPHPEESYDIFLQRRSGELVLDGVSPLRAGLEADAEWRAHIGAAAEPPQAPVSAAAADHGFCGQCGAPLSGTPFCGKCGARVA